MLVLKENFFLMCVRVRERERESCGRESVNGVFEESECVNGVVLGEVSLYRVDGLMHVRHLELSFGSSRGSIDV
jgi:hypothetical protein